MSNYVDFVESAINRLSNIDMFDTYLSNEDRVKYKKIYDDVCTELNSRIQSDDTFVVEMYYSFISNGYFISPQFDWSLVHGGFSDLSSIKQDIRLYRLYQEAENRHKQESVNKRDALIEKLKARRLIRRINKRKI